MQAWYRPKNLIFAFIAVMGVYVLYHNERFLITPNDPIWAHYATIKWWLLVHGLVGMTVFIAGPLQFSERLRRNYARIHRGSGYVYILGIAVLAPLGAIIQLIDEKTGGPRSFTVLAVVNALMLYVFTGLALLFIIRGRIKQHREWMTRSFSTALVFFEGRFVGGITGWELMGVEIVQAIIWACLIFALIAAEVVNNWQEITMLFKPQPKKKSASDADLALAEGS